MLVHRCRLVGDEIAALTNYDAFGLSQVLSLLAHGPSLVGSASGRKKHLTLCFKVLFHSLCNKLTVLRKCIFIPVPVDDNLVCSTLGHAA